ncbi:LAME_0H16424g1_1 [Lachancea meyersii CBS 8951]|uniref:LAME_0H16424g1_1 n=1 Tax=Lachancea meyersii CBS 8951 TaxID=1266667 RepID=A0A1G4KIG8_9SACH|nr:LAME_0H16424g1_1 [Lachancea meyersii CBS 8951]
MTPLLPSPASYHATTLPKLDPGQESLLSECEKRALTLDCRTGASTVLTRSSVFVYGGFTIPLNLTEINSVSIQQELILYFARESKYKGTFQNLGDWISRELFHMDLISRKWDLMPTEVDQSQEAKGAQDGAPLVTMKERVFHSMCYHDGHMYLFGGLVVSPQSGYELIASNELWDLDFRTKNWRLISCNPSIARRFNHNMHIMPGPEDEDDTLLYIVGGCNNLDRPINVVDIYNLTKGRWESLDESSPKPQDLTTNIDGQDSHLLQNSNFSLLIRDQATKKPLIVSYAPSETDEDVNPVVIQPLSPGPNGKRLPAFRRYSSWGSQKYKAPFHLQHPSGGYFGQNIIISGFYPDLQPSSFHCFTYNIPTGKWTEINTVSDDPIGASHRLWQLFVWHSHHKVVLLGTMMKEDYLPSVQRFSSVLCVALPMINVFHKAHHLAVGRERSGANLDQLSFDYDGFEGYSRYSAPPLEITTIASVFPSYAMALGKDSLELCGQHLSDFEIVTEDGDSVRVPLLLLRRRWGRYFDEVLAHGYVKASKAFEDQNRDNEFSKFSSGSAHFSSTPTTQQFDSTSLKDAGDSFPQEPLDLNSLKNEQSQPTQPLFPLITRKSSPFFFANRRGSGDVTDSYKKEGRQRPTNLSSQGAPESHHSKSDPSTSLLSQHSSKEFNDVADTPKTGSSSFDTSKLTSSSGGMVFRLPFQENSGRSAVPLPLLQVLNDDPSRLEELEKQSGNAARRKSSASASFLFDGGIRGLRRASHPIFQNPIEKSTISQSPFGSRKASIASQNSSISFVSSTSDRMGNSATRRTSQDSGLSTSTLNSLSSQLPPLLPMPSEPVPATPHQLHHDGANPTTSLKNSPFSSRRSSFYHDVLRPELSSSVSQPLLGVHGTAAQDNVALNEQVPNMARKRSIDRQLLEDNLIDVELETSLKSPNHRATPTKDLKQTIKNSNARSTLESDGSRPSYLSMADSSASINFSIEHELEPLLLPRSLYMPWPTSTIRSFIEFFYTGQVNGKWLLSPVALNLLVMAKIYEIPLLYDLMVEAFYSILGRKEESLLAIIESLKPILHPNQDKGNCESEETTQEFSDLNVARQELLEFEESLHAVDDGFFDTRLLKRFSRNGSNCSSESGEGISAIKENKESDTLNVPIIFAGGPRGSHNSVGSCGTPTTMMAGRMKLNSPKGSRGTKSSSLSKEVTLRDSAARQFNGYNSDSNVTRERSEETDRENNADRMEQQKLSNMSQNVNYEVSYKIMDLKPSELCRGPLENVGEIAADGEIECGNKVEKVETNSKPRNYSSSSDSDDIDAGFGLSSTSKIDKKLRQREPDASVDPLVKKSNSAGSSLKNLIDFFKKGDHVNRPGSQKKTVDNLTLANMASASSFPPVDYVIELIHETATLVHDVRLIVRCVSVITLSKKLKLLKQRLEQISASRANETKHSCTSTERTSTDPQSVPPRSQDHTPVASAPVAAVPLTDKLTRSESKTCLDRKSPNSSSPNLAGIRANEVTERSSKFASSEISLSEKSDSSSIDTKGSKKVNSLRAKKKNSHMAGSGLTGAALFMTGPFAPIPPKPKKESTSSSLNSTSKGGKSFFGKRKT